MKTTTILSKDSRRPGLDSNQTSPEYKPVAYLVLLPSHTTPQLSWYREIALTSKDGTRSASRATGYGTDSRQKQTVPVSQSSGLPTFRDHPLQYHRLDIPWLVTINRDLIHTAGQTAFPTLPLLRGSLSAKSSTISFFTEVHCFPAVWNETLFLLVTAFYASQEVFTFY